MVNEDSVLSVVNLLTERMKIIAGILSLVVFFGFGVAGAQDEWRQSNSEHFNIYYKKFDRDFLSQLKQRSETLYRVITDDLGYRRFNFWTWDNRAGIYIYNDKEDFLKSTGYSEWANGVSHPMIKKIESYYGAADNFFDTVLPHELGHLMLREFVGGEADIPLWFDEGVASRAESGSSEYSGKAVKQAINDKSFIPLGRLSAIDIRNEKGQKLVQLFYAESFAAVDFLIRRYSRDRFMSLCRDLRDGKSFSEALYRNYYRKTLDDLNVEFKEYLTGAETGKFQ